MRWSSTTLAGRLKVDLLDLQVSHSFESTACVFLVNIRADDADHFERGLRGLGYGVDREAAD